MSVHEITEAIDMRLLAVIARSGPLTVEEAANQAKLSVDAALDAIGRLAGRVRAYRPTERGTMGPVHVKAA